MTSNGLLPATDRQLLQLSRNGDACAFGQLVERYQSLVCSVAFSRCGELALSEDLAQEAFIVAWQKLSDLKDAAKFKAWVCTIARNLANRASQRPGRRDLTTLDAVADVATLSESPVEHAIRTEEEMLVWRALAEVPEKYREPLILFYREEKSVARVAEALNLSQDVVKQRLSRGRKMMQDHLAATVESVLRDSKPNKKFTAAVFAAVAGLSANTAAAAGLPAGVASVASATPGVGGLASLWLGPLLQLPVIGWLYKVSYAEMRTDQERKLWLRLAFWTHCGLIAFAAAAFSFAWWQEHVEPVWLRGLVIPGMMVVFMVPTVVFCRRFGKQVMALRRAEGRSTEPQPLVEASSHERQIWKTRLAFCASGLLVMVWPAILPLVAGDWWIAAGMLALPLLVGWVFAQLSLRYPHLAFQMYGVGLAIGVLSATGILFWKSESWSLAFANYLPWYAGALQASAMTMVILTTVAWKRVHGRREKPL